MRGLPRAAFVAPNEVIMRPASLAILVLTACSTLSAQSNSTPAKPAPASSPSALSQDRHAGFSISVDPYTDAERAKEKFGKSANPVEVGILPVEVFFKNETPHPIKVNLETVQLDVHLQSGGRQDLDWLPVKRVATFIVHPGGTPSAPSERRFPIGVNTGQDKKVDKVVDQLRPFALDSDVVPPLGSIHGFLFFNVDRNFAVASTSTLYVPDVATLPDNAPLMFFEVPLTPRGSPAATPPSQP
jgi:hypothetical protein